MGASNANQDDTVVSKKRSLAEKQKETTATHEANGSGTAIQKGF
jgi:hypothetical protein